MIDTDLVGRVERLHLAPRNALLPLFEAVSNSIDAIRACPNARGGFIDVHVSRDSTKGQLRLHGESLEPIDEIRIADNGIGFTADNMAAFKKLDTRQKIASGGKGIGRLTWLKVFESVAVSSVWWDATCCRKRTFDFLLPDGVENISDSTIDGPPLLENKTIIILRHPKDPYCETMRYRTETIAASLARYFLYYLLEPASPQIIVTDREASITLSIDNVIARSTDHFQINKNHFTIEHLKIRSPHKSQHIVNYCANHRPVREERIRHFPEHKFEDDQDGFSYHAYVSSPYLDTCSDALRTTLVLDDEPNLFGVSEKELRDQVNIAADQFVSRELNILNEEQERRIDRIIETNVPQLKYVRNFNRDEVSAKITFDNTDAEVESIIGDIHLKNQKNAHALMEDLVKNLRDSVTLDLKSFEDTFSDRIKKITGPNEANLASYVLPIARPERCFWCRAGQRRNV